MEKLLLPLYGEGQDAKNLFEKSESVLEEGYFGVNALKIRRFWASKDQTMTLLPTFQTGSKQFSI